jgi:replicative DNA helicase
MSQKNKKDTKKPAFRMSEIIGKHFQNGNIKPPISTGYKEIDEYAGGGIYRSFFTILAGESGNGKTTFMEMMSLHQALNGYKVLIISLELTKEMIAEKYLARLDTGKDAGFEKWRAFNVPKEKMDAVRVDALCLASLIDETLFIDDNPYTPSELAERIKQAAAEGMDIVYIDYFQSLELDESGNEAWAYNSASKTIRQAVKESKDLAVVLLSQVTEQQGKDPDPQKAKLRYAKQLLNDTSLELIIYRDEDPPEVGEEINIFLRKNRFGTRHTLVNLPFLPKRGLIGKLEVPNVKVDRETIKYEDNIRWAKQIKQKNA